MYQTYRNKEGKIVTRWTRGSYYKNTWSLGMDEYDLFASNPPDEVNIVNALSRKSRGILDSAGIQKAIEKSELKANENGQLIRVLPVKP